MSFATEAELVAAFVAKVQSYYSRDCPWTPYAETAGFDLLLQHRDGYQLGIEAKLSLNAKVIEQAIEGGHCFHHHDVGPDYRGVLVPAGKVQHHLGKICKALGVGIIAFRPDGNGTYYGLSLPCEDLGWEEWPNWCPTERCPLPDYVPDVTGGHKSPVRLTPWKIKAIKLLILLERRGYVTRRDMKALQISPSLWTDPYVGYLHRDEANRRYVKGTRTPDLKRQHPDNWEQIEADFDKWGAALPEPATQAALL